VQQIQCAQYVEFLWGLEQSKKQVNDAAGYTVSDLTNHTAFSGHIIIINRLINSMYHLDKTFG